ncbi:hypothetical protein CYMTET_17622 [Cymbomonas tetramitiformis]|uniref:Uncharacterized protein n=1 Tax=Cymbomonas tetramitiformis TaxID=36881 RepID=A0AAE0G9Q5_9CHLO|nr:hypothetical protein CYMTET_17622 [Cymbomonas tetramitiformis]
MSSDGFLLDILPWLSSIGEQAKDFPTDYPIAEENAERGIELSRKISEFAAHWRDTGAGSAGTPLADQVAEVAEPTSTAIKRRASNVQRQRISRSKKCLRLDSTATCADASRAQASEVTAVVPRGSQSYWNKKIGAVFQNSPGIIAGALANYIRTLNSDNQNLLRTLLASAEESVGQIMVSSFRESFSALATTRTNQNQDTQLSGAAMAFGEAARGMENRIADVLYIRRPVVVTGIVGHRNLLDGASLGTVQRLRSGLLEGLVRKNRNLANQMANELFIAKIHDFWLSPGITRVSTSKRDVLKLKHPDGTTEKAPKHWLEMTQLEVYRKFQKKEPGIKIGLRCFEQNKPKQVRRLTRRDTISCCCRYHEDMRLAVTAYQRAHERLHSKCECPDRECCPHTGGQRAVMSNRKPPPGFPDVVCGRAEVTRSTSGFTASLLCPRRTLESGERADFHELACLDQSCKDCGPLQNLSLCATEVSNPTPVEWNTYESALVGVDEDGKNKHRVQYVQKRTPVGELLAKLQSALLGHTPGESPNCSTEENPIIIKDYIYLIGDDMPHSHRSIQHMRMLIVKDYFIKRGIPLPKFVHEWADGSAVQNKCGTAFADVVESGRPMCAEWVRGLGIPCQRNLFETAHARGEQDAMGVIVKHEASLAVMAAPDKWYGGITCARHLWEFCIERLQDPKDTTWSRGSQFCKRFFFLVEKGDVDESGPVFDTVDRTLRLHSVRAGVGLLVGLKRDRQCYCEYCYAQCERAHPDSAGCHYKSHVDEWVPFTLTVKEATQARQTRRQAAEAAHEMGVMVARGSIFARPSGGDDLHSYYLVKALGGVQVVEDPAGMKDDYYSPAGEGVYATCGEYVVEGRFLEWRDEETCTEYFVDTSKKCLTYSHHIACVDVIMTKRRIGRKDYYHLSDAEHQRILGLLF